MTLKTEHNAILLMSRLTLLFCALPLIVSAQETHAGTEDYQAIFEQASSSVTRSYQENWSFTESKREDETTLVGQYDPRRAESDRWRLLSVDDRAPTEDEIEDFLNEKRKEREKAQAAAQDDEKEDRTSKRGKRDINKMVRRDSLSLLEETDQYWLFSFIPEDDDGEFSANVDGRLRIRKSGQTLDFLEMQSREPFKPAFGVKINEFYTHLAFEPFEMDGPVLLRHIQVRVNLRAFLVAKINKLIEISLSEFEFVGDDRTKTQMATP